MGSSGLVATLILPVLLLIQLGAGFAQNGDWYGYCCTDRTYCGDDCQSASCTESGSIPEPGGGNVGITKSFFDNIMSKVSSNCEGKGFYTYDAFVTAANAYTGFGTTGSNGVRKRELAAFFANVMQETGGFCYINEINPPQVYCQSGTPCASGKSYHGRGPLQLTWNYNYKVAGEDIGFDGINNPEVVGQDPIVSFKTAVWFWMKDISCHQVITSGQGFGATIKAINGMECNGGNPAEVSSRVGYYKSFCQQLGVDPGANLSC